MFGIIVSLPPEPPVCTSTACETIVSAEELLAMADRLTAARNFAQAEPLLKALEAADKLKPERQFLQGYIAVEQGQFDEAVKLFRSVLEARPDLVRARLELARVLALLGRNQAADYHFRLAGATGSLPDELARAVFAARAVLRNRDSVGFDVAFGLAPDTNINNASTERALEIDFLGERLPLQLSDDARQTSGLGLTATVAGRVRQPVGETLSVVGETFIRGTVYPTAKSNFNDYNLSLAAGPEWSLALGKTRLSALAQYSNRWLGGQQIQSSSGVKFIAEHTINRATRVTGVVDGRLLDSELGDGFGGKQLQGRISLDRVIWKSFVATASIAVRRDALRDPAFSTTEVGMLFGLSGELPMGVNVSAGFDIARSGADAAAPLLSSQPRRDWRYGTRLTVGSRRIQYAGFSPVIAYSYFGANSSVPFFSFSRHRLEVSVTRIL